VARPEGPAEGPVEGPVGDLRLPVLGLLAWAGALLGLLLDRGALVAVVLVLVVAGGVAAIGAVRRPGPTDRTRATTLLAGVVIVAGVAIPAHVRAVATADGSVADLAEQRAAVSVVGLVVTDARQREGRFGGYQVVRVQVREVEGRGVRHTTRVPVVVIAPEDWPEVALGDTVELAGRLAPADGEVAGILSVRRAPVVRARAGVAFDAAAAVRSALRASVDHLPPEERSLIPALVVGDEQGMPADLVVDFQVSGLTHLLAVSGTNLTLVVGFLLLAARGCGVRGRGLLVVGLVGVAGFVLLARTEPSVVRAAAMGIVGLLAMSSGGRRRGPRGLGAAIVGLLLFDPWLATTVGFALSACATAGIVFIAPVWRDAMATWLPRWVAEAVSVPLAAQIACTPIVAAISEQVSLVAVASNILAAPAVGPATVCGLVGALVGVASEPLSRAPGSVAGAAGWWIVTVAERSGALALPAVDWSAAPLALTGLVVACVLVTAVLGRLLCQRVPTLALALALGVVVVVPLQPPGLLPGWGSAPPDGWVVAACDVGQGDALLLRAGPGSAVLVDAGPDPPALRRCLRRFGVTHLAAVVLTHFHADHVAGLPAALAAARVDEIWVSPLAEPAGGARSVATAAQDAGVPVTVARVGDLRQVGEVRWQVVGPARRTTSANDASIVQVAEVGGLRVLLTGDVEPAAQAALVATLRGESVDVLKVPHHGSAAQDPRLLTSLGAPLALISVGADNDYGHPAPETLALLDGAGAAVLRTDLDGDLAVVVDADTGRWAGVGASGRRVDGPAP